MCDPTSPLDYVHLKTTQGRVHLQEIATAVASWRAACTPQLDLQRHDNYDVYRLVDLPEAPAQWAITIGEALYCLRSALDNLMWELIAHNNSEGSTQTYFPVLLKKDTARFSTMVRGASPQVVEAIERLQPYHSIDSMRDPLWQIHELNRIDKHRSVPVVARGVSEQQITVDVGGNVEIAPFLGTRQEGDEVLRVGPRASASAPPPASPSVTLDAYIAATESTPELSLSRDLPLLGFAVEAVVEELARISASQ